MDSSTGRSWSALRWFVATLILAVALVSATTLTGQTAPATALPAAWDSSSLKALTKIANVTAILPTELKKKPSVILFLAAKVKGEPFEQQFGTKETWPRLANELGAVLLFAGPDLKSFPADLKKAVAASPANRYGLTVAGVGEATPAALHLFAEDDSPADTLVLVNPDPLTDAADLGKTAVDTRPCLILASPAAAKGVEAVKAALTKRTEKAEIVEAKLADGGKFPLNHLATAMKWTVPAATLRRGEPLLVPATPVPAAGQERIDALTGLVDLQDAVAQAAVALTNPAGLKEMTEAPALSKTDAYFVALQGRFKLLDPIRRITAAKVAKKLEQAKAAAVKQVPDLQTAMQKAATDKDRDALRQKFLAENFPWPELVGTKAASGTATEDQFMAFIKAKCVKCHARQATSMRDLVKYKWVVAGSPEGSKVYVILGVNGQPGLSTAGTVKPYHNVTEQERNMVRDFIKQMPKE